MLTEPVVLRISALAPTAVSPLPSVLAADVLLFLQVKKPRLERTIQEDAEDNDGLNFLAGKTMDEVNKKAAIGTALAHIDGGVPNLLIELDELNEFAFGELVYFFEKACAISGTLLGVNPFDQPGVEAYKKNMFALLGKPGFEEEKQELENRIAQNK